MSAMLVATLAAMVAATRILDIYSEREPFRETAADLNVFGIDKVCRNERKDDHNDGSGRNDLCQ